MSRVLGGWIPLAITFLMATGAPSDRHLVSAAEILLISTAGGMAWQAISPRQLIPRVGTFCIFCAVLITFPVVLAIVAPVTPSSLHHDSYCIAVWAIGTAVGLTIANKALLCSERR